MNHELFPYVCGDCRLSGATLKKACILMLSINEIKKPIAADIDVFEGKFKASMQSSVPLLDRITHYIVKRKGKQIRPMFVFFSASICGGINESTHRGAALVELLHTATLIHDDVVDDSNRLPSRNYIARLRALAKQSAVLAEDVPAMGYLPHRLREVRRRTAGSNS